MEALHLASRFGRRTFLKLAAIGLGQPLSFPLLQASPTERVPPHVAPSSEVRRFRSDVDVLVSHEQVLNDLSADVKARGLEGFLESFQALLLETARACVVDQGTWIIPSAAYREFFFARDSFWVLATLMDRTLSAMALERFRQDQALTEDGHITNALAKGGPPPSPDRLDRDDESTMMYVLHAYLLKQLGGGPDLDSLRRAYAFIAAHISGGRYVTTGERRSGPAFGGMSQIGTHHYWLDTYRPAGKPEATPEVIGYNQGLLCVALRCLGELGIDVEDDTRRQAEEAYRGMVNPGDGVSLPQREGSTAMDVSALVGEALSLYWFDTPLLSSIRVAATLDRLAKVYYWDGAFFGFRVISSFDGSYWPDEEFSPPEANQPGWYQNGASWLLYDALALYAAARHGVTGAPALWLDRLRSEVRQSWASHEFMASTLPGLGDFEVQRDGHGWNAFVARLLPSPLIDGGTAGRAGPAERNSRAGKSWASPRLASRLSRV